MDFLFLYRPLLLLSLLLLMLRLTTTGTCSANAEDFSSRIERKAFPWFDFMRSKISNCSNKNFHLWQQFPHFLESISILCCLSHTCRTLCSPWNFPDRLIACCEFSSTFTYVWNVSWMRENLRMENRFPFQCRIFFFSSSLTCKSERSSS